MHGANAPHPHEHGVQFYGDTFPAGAVAAFLAEALLRGEGAVVLATPAHASAIFAALRAHGVDPDAARDARQLLLSDAGETLAALPLDRGNGDDLDAVVERLLAPMIERYPRFRAWGEMVDLLVLEEEPDRAVRLEHAWSRVSAKYRIPRLCTYQLGGLDRFPAHFRAICDAHAAVRPIDAGTNGETTDGGSRDVEPGRLVAQIQHQSRALEHELHRRQKLESDTARSRTQAERIAEHLGALQTITAALSEAASVSDVARAASLDMTRVLGARCGAVAVVQPDGMLEVLDPTGSVAAFGDPTFRIPIDAARPIATVFRTGQPLFLDTEAAISQFPELEPAHPFGALFALPLTVSGRKLGVVAFGFLEAREFPDVVRALAEDLARQTALALDRAQLFDQANEANRRKDEFLAVLGHELRNPLAPITTALQLMRLRGDAAHERERAVIERQVVHVSRLVDDLLDVSRITRGKLELKKERVELGSVIASAMEMASPLFEQRSHRVTLDVAREGLLVEVDRTRFAQAIANLLTNAAKYTDTAGEICVTADRVDGGVRIRIRDNGAGIRADVLPFLFEAFVQGRRTLQRAQGGLGLGLALVKSLLELHGGSVAAHSDGPGHGSEFTLFVPAAPPPPPLLEPHEPFATTPFAAGRRILVVDDNPDAADVLGEMFRLVGHDVAVAYDGPSALRTARDFEFDVAILDIGLPVMDGYELARRLREDAGTRDVCFIAVTGYGTEEDRARTRDSGFSAHLTKPVEPQRLLELIGAPRRAFPD